ncbi:hypothetical protein [uncultured Massilia sp.]|uniref:hypothetical protein n=1 Tax=uncultured Massilia sp. TaxID=169973 RepID=UPI0025D7C57F|nr:hypothetical protein [uncultured Massilia sp.]
MPPFSAARRCLALAAALGACAAAQGTENDEWRAAGIEAFRAGDHATAYAKWLPGASGGDPVQQELIADLFLKGIEARLAGRRR